ALAVLDPESVARPPDHAGLRNPSSAGLSISLRLQLLSKAFAIDRVWRAQRAAQRRRHAAARFLHDEVRGAATTNAANARPSQLRSHRLRQAMSATRHRRRALRPVRGFAP